MIVTFKTTIGCAKTHTQGLTRCCKDFVYELYYSSRSTCKMLDQIELNVKLFLNYVQESNVKFCIFNESNDAYYQFISIYFAYKIIVYNIYLITK